MGEGFSLKTLLKGLTGLVFLCVVLLAVTLWYVQPNQKLDLSYAELPMKDKVFSMLMSRKLEVTLSEQEVNDLLKKALAQHTQVKPGVTLTGARFYLQGERLTADVNLLVQGSYLAEATLDFELGWEEPNLTAIHTGTRIKDIRVPLGWFRLEPLRLPLNDYLPRRLTVRDIGFSGSTVKVGFKLR
ncbi:hypothetical protein O9H85_33255 [Paenibacillus filicis]|uniref:DUF2140 domain-containing protein n=1 Tax=Paenibacillus gyeongsangnamensis TaxID=3388067 RepID=A0ABT4QJU1_9BACL|nr:hypothetical protein [Paenibacillus filicis]MCZ8517136.1 hypothetical protein [Paenibacillus filicis]